MNTGQVEEFNNSFKEINDSLQEISIRKLLKTKEKLQTPYEKYVASGDYMLVYSRYKDFKFTKDQINFAGIFYVDYSIGNEVRLDCLRSTEEPKFKLVKPF